MPTLACPHRLALATLAATLAYLLLSPSQTNPSPTNVPPTEAIYIWNRHYDPTLAASISLADASFDSIALLASEIQTDSAGQNLDAHLPVPLDWPLLAPLQSPITLCFRLLSWTGSFGPEDLALAQLQAAIDSTLTAAIARLLPRFHYRNTAAAHAWQAALRLPDNDPRAATILASAGNWLKRRDPVAADPFFKALVIRCPRTPLGERATRLNRLPDTPEAIDWPQPRQLPLP